MKTFQQSVTKAIEHAHKTGEIGIAVISYGFTIFANSNTRVAGEFFVAYPNRDIVVAEFVEAR